MRAWRQTCDCWDARGPRKSLGCDTLQKSKHLQLIIDNENVNISLYRNIVGDKGGSCSDKKFFSQVISLPSRIDAHQTSAVVTLYGQLYVRVPIAEDKST